MSSLYGITFRIKKQRDENGGNAMKELAKSILQLVGGKENVKNCTHCVTRLRLLLVDESKADTEAIKKMNGVLAVVNKGGQYQIVLGDKVNDAYDEFVALMGGESGAAAATPQKKKRGVKNFSAALLDITTSIFSPIIIAWAVVIVAAFLLTLFFGIDESHDTPEAVGKPSGLLGGKKIADKMKKNTESKAASTMVEATKTE